VVTDVASGLNEKRNGLQELLDMAVKHEMDIVVIEFRDRLTRLASSTSLGSSSHTVLE